MRALLIDYGAGNLHSIAKAMEREGARVTIGPPEAAALAHADALVLPGVGAFGAAAAVLAPAMPDLRRALDEGMPCLAVCLGMQLLFDASDEGSGPGLGLLPGRVRRLRARRSPHIGWNVVRSTDGRDAAHFYFAHGYVAHPADDRVVDGWSEIEGDRFPASVRFGRVRGVQFHPEKSGPNGLALIRTFIEEAS